jgi:hypothetical protein
MRETQRDGVLLLLEFPRSLNKCVVILSERWISEAQFISISISCSRRDLFLVFCHEEEQNNSHHCEHAEGGFLAVPCF